MDKYLLSLCIPTNGIVEWVVPVLESIFSQCASKEAYEVIIADNGDNELFKIAIQKYIDKYNNFLYKRTNATGFLNQVESFKLASGTFVKFINHRTALKDGALSLLLSFVKENENSKPAVFFTNEKLEKSSEIVILDSFDEFIAELSIQSSWSAGLGFWKSDFERIVSFNYTFNTLFPHTTILFNIDYKEHYIIDNRALITEISTSNKKGLYNIFYAFSIEYISLLCDLVRKGVLSISSFLKIKNELLTFCLDLYIQFVVLHNECSYDLSYCNQYLSVYYSKNELIRRGLCRFPYTACRTLKHAIWK